MTLMEWMPLAVATIAPRDNYADGGRTSVDGRNSTASLT